jgi:hypothetical protein
MKNGSLIREPLRSRMSALMSISTTIRVPRSDRPGLNYNSATAYHSIRKREFALPDVPNEA